MNAAVIALGIQASVILLDTSLPRLREADRIFQGRLMHRRGRQIWASLQDQASRHGVPINLTGHVTMPYVSFPGEKGHSLRENFSRECAAHGVYLHPRHNCFMSAALTDEDMSVIAGATDAALAAMAAELNSRGDR